MARLAFATFALFAIGTFGPFAARLPLLLTLRAVTPRFTLLLTVRTLAAWLPLVFALWPITTHFALFAAFAATLFTFAAFFAARTETIAAPAPASALAIATAIKLLLLALREFDVRLIGAFGGDGVITVRAFTFCATLVTVFIILIVAKICLWRRRGRLHQSHKAEIMIGVLEIILAQHTVTRRRRVARQLEIALIDMRRRTANLYVRPVALHRPIRVLIIPVVMMMTTAARLTTAAPLTLH